MTPQRLTSEGIELADQARCKIVAALAVLPEGAEGLHLLRRAENQAMALLETLRRVHSIVPAREE